MSLYVPPKPEAAKAGPVGPGAGPLMTEFLLPMMLPTDSARKMRTAWNMGESVSYIFAAERVISGKFSTVDWHLEDPEGETIDDEYAGDPRALAAYNLLDKPQGALSLDDVGLRRSRRQLWEITSRHMGLCGQGYWYQDSPNEFGIPSAWLYIRPDRLTPRTNAAGVLIEWRLDRGTPGNPDGTPLAVEDVIQFTLQTPNEGYLATGLIEACITKAQLSGAIDKYFASVVSGAGRMSGIIAPKQGAITDDGVYNQLVRDWRNIVEQPESAKRVQVVRAPVDFIRTVMTADEMAMIDFMEKNTQGLLALWGVPLSQIGGYTPTGLNSGDVRKFDEAALWQNAVHPRLMEIIEPLQNVLDRYRPYLGWAPQLIFDEPEFDDDSPRYDKLQRSQFLPMRNFERRALVGLDPFGPQVIGSTGQAMDDEIILPMTITTVGAAPSAPNAAPPVNAAATGAVATTQDDSGGDTEDIQGQKAKVDVTDAVLAALRKQWDDADLAIVKQGTWTFDPKFPMNKINDERRPIARNPKIVAGVEDQLKIGAPIAPVTLIHTKRIGKPGYEPIDGWHRTLAASHVGLDTIPAYVGEGNDAWTSAILRIDDTIPTPPDSGGQAQAPASQDSKAVIPPHLQPYHRSLTQLRANVQERVTPLLRTSVNHVLEQQRADVVRRVQMHYAELQAKPRDTTLYWIASKHDEALVNALKPALTGVAETVRTHVTTTIGAGREMKAGPVAPAGAVHHVLTRGAARVHGINETTRLALADIVAQGIEDGSSPAELGDAIEAWSGWDEYRSEMIARTELMDAYNAAAIGSYDELGVETVTAIDGDGDPECAERDGQTFTLDEADSIEDHPNGTLDWIPDTDSIKAKDLGRLADAVSELANRPVVVKQKRARVTVKPKVRVDAPIVNVPEQKPMRHTVERDPRTNQITGTVDEPVDSE